MTTCHHGDCGSNSDAERRTSDDEKMENVEPTEIGPLLTTSTKAEKSRVSSRVEKKPTSQKFRVSKIFWLHFILQFCSPMYVLLFLQ